MDILKDPLLGKLTGKLGKKVYRIRNGKTIEYMLPETFIVSQTEAAVNSRQIFSASSKLASALKKDSLLKRIWQQADIPAGSAFHKIVSYNNRRTYKQDLTLDNALTPSGASLRITSVKFNETKIRFNLGPITKDNRSVLTPPFKIYVCIYAYSPNKYGKKRFCILLKSQTIEELPIPSTFILSLNKEENSLVSDHNQYIIFIAAARSKESEGSTACTSTYSCKLD